MLEITDGYRSAIVGDVRQMFIRAILDLSDPDMQIDGVVYDSQAPWSRSDQLQNKKMESNSRYSTLEVGRHLLDGSISLMPDDYTLPGEVGFVGGDLSDENGYFQTPVSIQLNYKTLSILQACSIYFSDDFIDGVARDFTVSVLTGDQVIYSRSYTDNWDRVISIEGFTVYDPTAIRLEITRWTLPFRRARVVEIIPGVYELWTEDVLASLSIQMRGNFAGLAIPYGTCSLRMDNLDRRFEPRNRNGIFKSIEERQSIIVSLGTALSDGTREYKQVGVFYQYSGGWTTSNNAMTMEWNLVDIIGLLSQREFIPPSPLPTTLSGWIAALAAQLGGNFAKRWHVDPDYADIEATVSSAEDVQGKKCGDLLRFVCMATGTWPRADAETGYLTAEPLWNQGNKYTLDNLNTYPVMKANEDLAVLIFKLYDGDGTIFTVSGNATASEKTLTINNPFIHTQAQALAASKMILTQYGGIRLETTGRGDPASEIGDVDTIWLNESTATTARRMEQSFNFVGGVLRDCKSLLLQADGSFLYENQAVITSTGVFHTPAHTDKLRIILVGKGENGQRGQDGHVGGSGAVPGSGVSSGEGEKGADGVGGKVWSGVVNVNPDSDYDITIDLEATFGVYSSANGQVYPYGFTDIASGSSYARTGVANPLPGSGDGGAGGAGGEAGAGYWEPQYITEEDVDNGRFPGHNSQGESTVGKLHGWDFIVTKEPGPGQPGKAGAYGCCVIWWEKEA